MDVLRLVTPTHPAAAPLLDGLRQEYAETYGREVAAELDRYSIIEFLPPAGAFLVLELAGATVAGGALRRLGPGVGEIKRMWTAPEQRGRGYSRRVLAALEGRGDAARLLHAASGDREPLARGHRPLPLLRLRADRRLRAVARAPALHLLREAATRFR